MSTFAEAFRLWPNFPKGLQVLVVDSDAQFVRSITYKLESHQFYVTSFSTEEEACAAFANRTPTFHVALVEAAENDALDSCKILSFLKNVPTVMVSKVENMSLMVKTIALGAVEFLVKPLLEDKLKNIWQHVIRKALDSSRDALLPGYLEPGKPTASGLAVVDEDHQSCSEHRRSVDVHSAVTVSVPSEGLATLSAPGLEQGGRAFLQESTLDESPRSPDSTEVCNYDKAPSTSETAAVASSDVKDVAEQLRDRVPDSKAAGKEENSVNRQAHIFCCTIPMLESVLHLETSDALQMQENRVLGSDSCSKIEGPSAGAPYSDVKLLTETFEMPNRTDAYEPQEAISSSLSEPVISKESAQCCNGDSTCQSEVLGRYYGHGDAEDESKSKSCDFGNGLKDSKFSKRKTKVDWTADLHRRFVQAVEYLGDKQAIPSRILEVMKVEGLTRHNVASHLQKYRSHKKHIQAREMEASGSGWHQSKGNCERQWNYTGGQCINQLWMQPYRQWIAPPIHVWGQPKVDNPSKKQFIPKVVPGVPTMPWKPSMADAWVPGLTSMAPWFGTYPNFFPAAGYPCKEALEYGMGRSTVKVDICSPDQKMRSKSTITQAYYLVCLSVSPLKPPKPLKQVSHIKLRSMNTIRESANIPA